MSGKQSHIFFLNYHQRLPSNFFHLAARLSAYGINLVPVSPSELANFARPHKQFVVALLPDMYCMGSHLNFRKKFLDFALKTRKFRLIEVSSFAEAEELAQFKRQECYDHIKLPVGIEFLARKLAVAVMSAEFDAKVWPGGRRAKLPAA